MLDELDCWGENEPRCPYCGTEVGDAWELNLDDGDSSMHECDDCGKEFKITASISISYTTTPKEGWPKGVE